MKGFEMPLFDHQRFAMLFQIETNLCDCCRIAEQKCIFNHLIEIEKFDPFQGTPYFFPATRKVSPIQDIHQRPLKASDSDVHTGTVNRDNAEVFFSHTAEWFGECDTTEYMGSERNREDRAGS